MKIGKGIFKFLGDFSRMQALAKFATWFITAVVIPLTIWFTVLRHDVSAGTRKVTEVEVKVVQLQESQNSDRAAWAQEMKEVQRSLGRIEGMLEQRRR